MLLAATRCDHVTAAADSLSNTLPPHPADQQRVKQGADQGDLHTVRQGDLATLPHCASVFSGQGPESAAMLASRGSSSTAA